MSSSKDQISTVQLLFPLSLLALVVFISLAFQTSAILRERQMLSDVNTQQEKPLEQAQKVQAQLDALALGTLKLSQHGNKDAEMIIARMKQLGITVAEPTAKTGDKTESISKPVPVPEGAGDKQAPPAP